MVGVGVFIGVNDFGWVCCSEVLIFVFRDGMTAHGSGFVCFLKPLFRVQSFLDSLCFF